VLEALREKNIQVPRDLSLISFDDIEIATYFNLTTMQQPMYLMGELAVRRLLDRIENPLLPVVSQTFTPSLIVRSSCGVDKNYTFHPN
jgi:LacI family transcriptional regulator